MADIGSLVVKLAAETAEFQADLGKSARLLDKHANEMKASLQSVANVAKSAFALAVGVTSVAAIKEFVLQTLEAAAALQGLSEQTGASVEALSGFQAVATISHNTLENIGGSLAKLAKGMAGVDDETAGATKALQFLGVDARDTAGNLRDPAEVMNDIALKLAQFEDGAGKTAIAMELFGKSGAGMLPFLKDLAENQDLNIRLSAEQVLAAEHAIKAMARTRAEYSYIAQTIVTSSIPAMNALGEELKKILLGSDDVVKGMQKLQQDKSITTWAETAAYSLAVVIDALHAIGKAIQAMVGSFQAVWADIELAGTFLGGGEGMNPFSEKNRAKLKEALTKRNEIVRQANQNYADLWNMPLLADALEKRFEAIRQGASGSDHGPDAPRKRLNYNTADVANSSNVVSAMENQVRALDRAVGEESSLLRDRQRIIDTYQSSGLISTEEAATARAAAEEAYLTKIRSIYDQEEALVKRSLQTNAKSTQDKLKLQEKLSEIASKRSNLEREASQSNLESFFKLSSINASQSMAGIDNEVKELQRLVDEESGILKDRQRLIDLYENAGYISFKEASQARVAAQEDFVSKIGALYAEQELLLEVALRKDAKTVQDKLKYEDKLSEIAKKRATLERDAQQSNTERLIRQPAETLKDLQEQAQRGQMELASIEEQIKTQRESRTISEVTSLTLLSQARQRSAEELTKLAAQAEAIASASPGNEKFADSFKSIAEAAQRAATASEQLAQRARELSDPSAGISKALKDVSEEASQVGRQMENATRSAFTGMTDALTQFVLTGKLSFRSLAQSIITDLIRIQIQSAITGPLAKAIGSMFPFADGGIMSSSGPVPLRAYASGGIATSPQLALFGEGSRPEAYVPLPDGRTIPVSLQGNRMGAAGGDVFNISVNVTEAGTAARRDESRGRDLGRAIASAVRQELLAQKRAGGLLDSRRAL